MRPHHVNEVVISAQQIERRVDELVQEMLNDCRAENFVMIGILRGSFMFLADLVRDLYHHGVRPRIDFLTLESYHGAQTESSGVVRIAKDITMDVQGADIMLIDDILDTGRTLSFGSNHLMAKGARSVKTCTLLDKPSRRIIPFHADFTGFMIEDRFVVGYGLDYDSYYRELPYIAQMTFTD